MSPRCHSPASAAAPATAMGATTTGIHKTRVSRRHASRDAHRDQHHRQRAHGTLRRYCDARTIKSKPSRPARCDTAEALMSSAAAMSFLVWLLNRPFRIRSDRSSSDPIRWSRQIRAALIGVDVGALFAPERRAHQRQAGLALRRSRPFDGLARRPPARTVLDARVGVEHRHRAPADAEPDVDAGRDGQPQ